MRTGSLLVTTQQPRSRRRLLHDLVGLVAVGLSVRVKSVAAARTTPDAPAVSVTNGIVTVTYDLERGVAGHAESGTLFRSDIVTSAT